MYTRCPTCSTCFRVTDRHLAIAHGKVRCGQCQLVFSAPDHAIDDLPVNQLTSTTKAKSAEVATSNSSSVTKKSPTSTPSKKVIPPPVAPTAKEKSKARKQASKTKKVVEKNQISRQHPDLILKRR